MTEVMTEMTAEERRRERRKARILGDSSSRLEKILSGPTGTESRLAPMMEGGEGFKIASPSPVEPEPSAPRDVQFPGPKVAASREQNNIFSFLTESRFQFVSFLGFVLFVLSTLDIVYNVPLAWCIVYLSFSIVEYQNHSSPQSSQLASALVYLGFHDKFVQNLTFYMESLMLFTSDTLTMLAVLISSHFLLFLYKASLAYL